MDNISSEQSRRLEEFTPEPLKPVGRPNSGIKSFLKKLGFFGGAAVGAAALGTTAAGQGGVVAEKIGDTVEDVVKVGMRDPIKDQINDARKNLESEGIQFGDIRPNSKHGENGIIYQRGSLDGVNISGTVGVGAVERQPVRVRSGEPTMKGKEVDIEDLQEQGVDLGDVWVTEVYGGPDTLPSQEEGSPADWVRFTVKDKEGNLLTLFAAQKFFTPNGEKRLEITNPDGSKTLAPLAQITK